MPDLLITNARVLTMLDPGAIRPPAGGRRGADSGILGIIPNAEVSIAGGLIERIQPRALGSIRSPGSSAGNEFDAQGRILMPGFVDCHTHACWAGSRIDEWERKLAGATYQEIMASGGGIMSTVRATRSATREQLTATLREHAARMLALGSTTIEVKSGYGLTSEAELKMLGAIVDAVIGPKSQTALPVNGPSIVPTALLGHAIDPEAPDFVTNTITRTLNAVSDQFPRIAIDAFCEQGAWSLEDCTRLFEAAKSRGHSIRVHADQFTSLGMVEKAIQLGARSVDHLEASTPETLQALAKSDTFAVGLPICGFHLDGRYAKLGEVVGQGGKVCIATNYNPGSAPSPSMPFAIALAVRHCGLTPQQAMVAATLNPAQLLGLNDRGYIAPGARADLILLRHTDERALAYEVGDNPVDLVIAGGRVLEVIE